MVSLFPLSAFQAVYLNCDLTLRDDCNKTTLLSIEHVRNG